MDTSQIPHELEELPDVLKALSGRQREFCKNYVIHNGNARKAARLAGYATECVESGNKGAIPYMLLGRPKVQQGIAYYREVFQTASHYTPEKLVHQWAQMASFDLLACVNDDYSLKDLRSLTASERQQLSMALVGLEVTEKKGKLYVKPQLARIEALKELGKLLGAYKDEGESKEGLTLTINVGQQAVVGHMGTEIGHLRIVTDDETPSTGDC